METVSAETVHQEVPEPQEFGTTENVSSQEPKTTDLVESESGLIEEVSALFGTRSFVGWQAWLDSLDTEWKDGAYVWFVGRRGETHGVHFVVENGRPQALPHETLVTFWNTLGHHVNGFVTHDVHGMGILNCKASANDALMIAYFLANALATQRGMADKVHVATWDCETDDTSLDKPDVLAAGIRQVDETQDGEAQDDETQDDKQQTKDMFCLLKLKKGEYKEHLIPLIPFP